VHVTEYRDLDQAVVDDARRYPHPWRFTACEHRARGRFTFGVVVDYGIFDNLRDRFVLCGLYSHKNAQDKADELNAMGDPPDLHGAHPWSVPA
jgi:hypothetical protein